MAIKTVAPPVRLERPLRRPQPTLVQIPRPRPLADKTTTVARLRMSKVAALIPQVQFVTHSISFSQ